MKRKNTFYSSKVKLEAIRFIKEDHFVKEIQKILNIKSEPQVYTWWYWYRDGELERFSQPIGKQYPYGHGPKGATPKETLKNQK